MRYSRILMLVLALYGVAVLIAYSFAGDNRYVDAMTVILFELVALTFMLELVTLGRRSLEIELMFVTCSMLFLCLHTFAYLLYPELVAYAGTVRHEIIHVQDVNRGLLYLCLGTAVFVAGVRVGAAVSPPRARARRSGPPPVNLGPLFFVGVYQVAFELMAGLYFGRFSTIISDANGGGWVGLVGRLVSSTTFVFLAVPVLIHQGRAMPSLKRNLLVAATVGVLLHETLVGSRQAVLVALLIGLAVLFDCRGDFFFRRRALLTLAAAALGCVFTFPAATIVRDYWNLSKSAGHNLSWSEFRDIESQPSAARPNMIKVLALRLNGLDPIFAVSSGHVVERDKYISVPIVLKSFVNVVVPGTPWPEARELSKTFLITYEGYPPEFLDYFYVTCMYTVWGDSWAMFGFAKGLLAMMVLGGVLAIVFSVLTRRRRRSSVFWRVAFIYMIYAVTVSFGMDTVGATAVYLALPLFVAMKLSGVYRRIPGTLHRKVSGPMPELLVSAPGQNV
ncbi:MAG: hypothetical protein ABI837_03005 [Acidobacteriota bacterium]